MDITRCTQYFSSCQLPIPNNSPHNIYYYYFWTWSLDNKQLSLSLDSVSILQRVPVWRGLLRCTELSCPPSGATWCCWCLWSRAERDLALTQTSLPAHQHQISESDSFHSDSLHTQTDIHTSTIRINLPRQDDKQIKTHHTYLPPPSFPPPS